MYINPITFTSVLMAQENKCSGSSVVFFWLIVLSNRLSAVSSLSN